MSDTSMPARPATTARCPGCQQPRYLTQTGRAVLRPHNRYGRARGRLVETRCSGSGRPALAGAR